jgi:hypothetical protein
MVRGIKPDFRKKNWFIEEPLTEKMAVHFVAEIQKNSPPLFSRLYTKIAVNRACCKTEVLQQAQYIYETFCV